MKIEFTLNREDFLQGQLFFTSQSSQIIKSRRKSRFLIPVVYMLLAMSLFILDEDFVGMIVFAFGLGWFLFSPLLQRKRYMRYLGKYIDEHFANRFDKPVTITFNPDYLEAVDYESEYKVKVTEIVEATEVRDYYFLKLSGGGSIIIPSYKLTLQRKELSETILELVEYAGIKQIINLDWKWK
jgi:hypothetical protein